MLMFSSWSSLPSRSRRSTSVTNTNTSTSRRRRPQLGTSYIPITLIILLAVSCSFSCGAGGVTAATLTDPSNVFLRRAPKSGQKRSSKSKKGYYSGSLEYYDSKSASPKKKSPPKKKSKSSKKTSLPTRQPTSDPTPAPSQAPSSSPSKVLWASAGGGWRSMAGEMGFANVFAQAGLITNESSAFSAVSTISGSSWFSTQFFYSSEFFTKVTTSTPDELAEFVLLWMDSYEAFSGRIITNPKCHTVFQNLTSGIPVLAELEALCNTVAEYDGDWAGLVQGMLAAASSAYGDPGLENRSVGVSNRVNAMNETDLYIQTSLAPNSRTRFVPQGPGIFLGPIYNSNDVEIYSIPIAVQYSVRQTGTLYYSTDLDDGGTVLNYPISLEEVVSPELKFPKEYKEFGLYPVPLNKTIFDPEIEDLKPTQLTLTEPFGGKIPTVTQVSAASSAADALYSPMQPTVFSQAFSKLRDAVDGFAKKRVFDKVVDQLYEEEIFDGQSVCTQWPQECGETDGQFLDGYFTDACSLALNIGQYQSQNSDDAFKREEEALKVILTDTNNQGEDGTGSILPYFNSPVNEGIAPGDYMWPDNLFLPMMSPQIFSLDMDLASLAGIMTTIPGIDVTVGRVQATTLDNPRFHVKAGQPVDILILRLNSIIPTVIIGTEAIQAYTNPLAEMAQGIAASEDLVNVIKDFMNVPATADAPHYWLPSFASQPLIASELGFGVGNVTENTLSAFLDGLALGASGVEVTSRLTMDGKIALIHNAMASNGLVVTESAFAQLPHGTVELADYLRAVPRPHGLNIMMANNEPWTGEPNYDPLQRVAEVVVRRVVAAGRANDTLLSAFNIQTVAKAAKLCRSPKYGPAGCGLRTAWLAMSSHDMRDLGVPPAYAPQMNSSQYLDQLEKYGLDAFNPEATLVDAALLEGARKRGVQLFVWWNGVNTKSVETTAEMQRLADCGITGFITPRVAMGIEAQRQKAPKRGATACDRPAEL